MHVHASDSRLSEDGSAKFFVKGNGDTVLQKREMMNDRETGEFPAQPPGMILVYFTGDVFTSSWLQRSCSPLVQCGRQNPGRDKSPRPALWERRSQF